MPTESFSMPSIRVRGRSFMALVIAPEMPLSEWLGVFDQHLSRAAGFFADRPIIANLATTLTAENGPLDALDALAARSLNIIGIEGIESEHLAGTKWEKLHNLARQLDNKRKNGADKFIDVPDDPVASAQTTAEPAQAAGSLLINRPVRSGQSIIFEDGDITIIGSVASGAEVIAGGSIHIYGALRGRAIAGLKTGANARIFCRKLAAELVAIDGLYDTADFLNGELHGRAAQIQIEHGSLKLSALD